LLEDSQTVIFGGLRREEHTVETDQIPILGDLPLIGYFFKSRRTVATHSELVVLLSPHIYTGEELPGHIAEKVQSLRRQSPLRAKFAPQTAAEPESAADKDEENKTLRSNTNGD
jgi:type II secretory pathway component GspD/PulD (secretin)